MAGCPVKAANHALKICDMAFDMMDGITMLKVDTCRRSQHFALLERAFSLLKAKWTH